jgi:uncharacterized protein YaiL (DUF2058 family)
MGNSLLDQLKKSGLVDKSKAQKSKHSQYKSQKKKSKKGAAASLDEATILANKNHAEKVARDRQLNQQQKEESERNAITAQIKQLIETNSVKEYDGDIAYNFTDGSIIKRIYVSEKIRRHLSTGCLAIAKLDDDYALVPTPVADKIKQRDTQCIITNDHGTTPPSNEEDPYADYQIPDDLMW